MNPYTMLTWMLLGCQPTTLYEAYITGPNTNNKTDGYRNIAENQSSVALAYEKPHLGCAIAWRLEPETCTPVNFQVDGVAWEGM